MFNESGGKQDVSSNDRGWAYFGIAAALSVGGIVGEIRGAHYEREDYCNVIVNQAFEMAGDLAIAKGSVDPDFLKVAKMTSTSLRSVCGPILNDKDARPAAVAGFLAEQIRKNDPTPMKEE